MAASRELLRDAIAIWRDTRAEGLVEIVDRLSAEMMRSWQAPAPRLHRTFHAAWLAAAADDVSRGWAADQLLAKLPDGEAVSERTRALIAAGPDPRVGRALVAHLDALRPWFAKQPALEGLVRELLAESADPDELFEARTADSAGLIDRVLALPRPPGRAPTPRELAYLSGTSSGGEADALAREVYAHPDDDAVRAILADALLAAGDPRGELIALQLASEASEAQHVRIAELLRDHGRAWLGALRELARGARFERGFVTGLELRAWTGGEARWQQLVEDPLLGTVEELIPGTMQGVHYGRLLTSPAMTALRRIEVFDTAVIEALEVTAARLVHVGCPAVEYGPYVRRLAEDVLPACVRFETLRSFACELEGVAAVLGSPIGARLTSLTVAGEIAAGLAFWRSLRQPIELAFVERATLAGLSHTGSILVRREGSRTLARVSGPWGMRSAVEHWPLLRADRLELVAPDATSTRLEQLASGTCELVRIPAERSRLGIIELERSPV